MPAADLQWTVIDDFRPGIFQRVTPNTPPGAAVEEGTYKCKSNSNGDLVPGPLLDLNAQITRDANLDAGAPGLNLYHIVGIQAVSPVLGDDTIKGRDQCNTQLFVAYDWIDEPDDRHRRLDRYLRDSSQTWENIYDVADTFAYSDDYTPARATFGLTRSNSADPTQSGASVLVVCQAEELRAFPDDTAPTVTGTVSLPQPVSPAPFPEMLIVHQGRVVLFPLSLQGFGDDEIWAHNEMMYWLTVNDVTTLDSEITGGYYNIVFGYENPSGYDNGASLSANELFLLKRYGGAIMLQGDLNQPRAVNLPNVMSPGFANSTGVQTPLGYCYVVDNGTLYTWRGGDTSEDLAPMMEPDFWRPITDVTLPASPDSPNERWRGNTQLALFRDLLLVPNNWYMDLTNAPDPASGGGGWWRLCDPASAIGEYLPRYSHYTCDWTGRWAWAAPYALEHGAANKVVMDEYDRSRSATSYSWKSVPLSESAERQLNVREVVVVLSGQGSVIITGYGRYEDDGVTRRQDVTDEIWVDSDYPMAVRRSLAVKGNLIQIQVQAEQGTQGGVTPSTTILSDSFDRTDSATVGDTDGGFAEDPATWVEVGGDIWSITDNHLCSEAGETASRIQPGSYAVADLEIDMDIVTLGSATSNYISMYARFINANNYYEARIFGDGQFEIWKRVAGTSSLIGTAGTPGDVVDGDAVAFMLDGDTLSTYINGDLFDTVMDSDLAAAGTFGLRTDAGGDCIDNFVVLELNIPIEPGEGEGGAPIIHQIRIGHSERERVGRQD